MFVDGALVDQGSGASIFLISPHEDELTYTLRFTFKATNNELEYEALSLGLQVQNLVILSDSQIIVNQV